jgi:hypothetical protein
MLYMIGNPLMLAPNYRNLLKTKFNKLKVLDGTPTLNEAEGSRKKKPKANSSLSTYGKDTGPDLVALVADI